MAATGTAPIQVRLETSSEASSTDQLLSEILKVHPGVSDLIFSPGGSCQVQIHGKLLPVDCPGLSPLHADDTRRIASDLIGTNKAAIGMLREQGHCDISYAVAGVARFRVNIFIQLGSCAVVMRAIPTTLPEFGSLGLPERLREITCLQDGLVLVTGPRGSGKSSTLAALLDHINENKTCHIITIEDPIEFLHSHKRSIVHQRELHSDTPTVSAAMRAALRQAPNIIAVGELKDQETVELALEAAETGHLVLSTLNAAHAQQSVDRLLAAFPTALVRSIQERLARLVRAIVCQRLIPEPSDGRQKAVFEVFDGGSKALSRLFEADGEGGLREGLRPGRKR